MTKRFLLSTVIVGLFALMALATKPKQKDAPEPPTRSATSAPEKVAPTKPEDVDLKGLLDEYKKNEVRADETYKGGVVRIKGHVWEVKKGLFDEIFVTVGPTKRWQLPMAACFVADAAAARPFNKGDAVVAEGRVDGLLINVLLRECVLTKQ